MKLSFTRDSQLKGELTIHLNHIIAVIEWKYFSPSCQLNLRLENLRYKDKDKFLRKKHEYDYLKPKVQEYMIREIKSLHVMKYNKIKNTVWWES